MAKKSLLGCFLLAAIPAATKAEPANAEVVKYYHALKKTPADIDAAGALFGEKLRDTITLGNPDNIAQMKVALMDVLLTLHRIKAESKMLQVIPSLAGKELFAAVDNYLKYQEKAIMESGPEIIRFAADGALSTNDKKAKIQALIEHNRKGAALVEAPFTRALVAFAREYELPGEPAVDFHEFILSDKSCKVLMPDITENKSSETNGVKNNYYLAEDKNGVFMLSYADIAPGGEEAAAQQKRLEDGRAGVIKKLNLKVNWESPITLAGKHPGLELEADLPDKSITRIRMYIVNGRLYQMWVVGSPTWARSAEANRFLKSLELLK